MATIEFFCQMMGIVLSLFVTNLQGFLEVLTQCVKLENRQKSNTAEDKQLHIMFTPFLFFAHCNVIHSVVAHHDMMIVMNSYPTVVGLIGCGVSTMKPLRWDYRGLYEAE